MIISLFQVPFSYLPHHQARSGVRFWVETPTGSFSRLVSPSLSTGNQGFGKKELIGEGGEDPKKAGQRLEELLERRRAVQAAGVCRPSNEQQEK